MRAVVQVCQRAEVRVAAMPDDAGARAAAPVARIGRGFLVLLGVAKDDTAEDAEQMAERIANLRVCRDEEGKMNRSLLDTGGEALVVSQFTLYGDARQGRRPSFIAAASGDEARRLYQAVVDGLSARGVPVGTGVFGAHMEVELVNDGPVTILLDSRKSF